MTTPEIVADGLALGNHPTDQSLSCCIIVLLLVPVVMSSIVVWS